MISTEQLDQSILRFENDAKQADKLLNLIEENHQLLLDILIGTNAEELSDDEMDYLLFLFAAMFDAFNRQNPVSSWDQKQIERAEEKAWEIINEKKDFSSAIQYLYDSLEEKDCVDFIELSIGPDEENEFNITESGRIIMLAVLTAELMLLSGTDLGESMS